MPQDNGTSAAETHHARVWRNGPEDSVPPQSVETPVRSAPDGARMAGHRPQDASGAQAMAPGAPGHSVPPPAHPQPRFTTAAGPGFSFPLTPEQVELTVKGLALKRSREDLSAFFQLSQVVWGAGRDGSATVNLQLFPYQVDAAIKERVVDLMAARGIVLPTVDVADFVQRARVRWNADGGATVTIEV